MEPGVVHLDVTIAHGVNDFSSALDFVRLRRLPFLVRSRA